MRPAVRDATEPDFLEVFRVAECMWSEMALPDANSIWRKNAVPRLKEELGTGNAKLLVADHPETAGELVAIGMGVIWNRIPTYWDPNGKLGYVQWFYTAPEYRRMGLASEMLQSILDWFKANDVGRANLHGSEDALSVYKAAGFEPTQYANYWWTA